MFLHSNLQRKSYLAGKSVDVFPLRDNSIVFSPQSIPITNDARLNWQLQLQDDFLNILQLGNSFFHFIYVLDSHSLNFSTICGNLNFPPF